MIKLLTNNRILKNKIISISEKKIILLFDSQDIQQILSQSFHFQHQEDRMKELFGLNEESQQDYQHRLYRLLNNRETSGR